MYICVDFDGTMVDHQYPEIGQPVPHAIKWLKKWQRNGAMLILYTMRSDQKQRKLLSEAARYLKDNGVQLYGINRNPDQDSWTSSPKAYGELYIDDSAFGCPLIHPKGFARPCVDWQKVGPHVDHLLLTRK